MPARPLDLVCATLPSAYEERQYKRELAFIFICTFCIDKDNSHLGVVTLSIAHKIFTPDMAPALTC